MELGSNPSASKGWPSPQQPIGVKMRACANCSRLKMKCRWPAGSLPTDITACTRCARLEIACSVPANAARKKRGKPNRVAQLEQKIDGIMSILESGQSSGQRSSAVATPHSHTASPLTADSQPNNIRPLVQLAPERRQDARQKVLVHVSEEWQPAPAVLDRGLGEKIQLVPGFSLTFSKASEYLDMYRKDYMPMFPFVIIEEDTKPHELYYSSPALFWIIMSSVAQKTDEVDTAVQNWFRHHISERLIVKQEKSLELVQAILMHLVWGTFVTYMDADTPLLISLAHNIILELKLDWLPEGGQALLGAAWCPKHKAYLMKRYKPHTSAEIRAVLGLHFVSAVTISMFRRGPGLSWNGYLTECCESMAAQGQHPLDEYMSASVRLQRIAHEGFSALPGAEYAWGQSGMVFTPTQEMTMKLTASNMEKFVASQRPEIQNNIMFRLLYHALLVRLYEPLLGMQHSAASQTTTTASANDASASARAAEPRRRTDMLWKLVEACKSFFDACLAVSLGEASRRPCNLSVFFAFAVVTSSRVVFHDAPDWDPAVGRRYLDLGAVMFIAAESLEEAEQWAKSAGHRLQMMDRQTSMLAMHARKMKWIKQWYESRIAAETQAAAAAQTVDGGVGCSDGSVEPVRMASAPDVRTLGDAAGRGTAGDSTMAGVGMLEENQQPISSFLPDFQFDEAFWQEMIMCLKPPPFATYTMESTN